MKDLIEYRGLWFNPDTPQEVMAVVKAHSERHPRCRLRFHYGDQQTGRDWLEEFECEGYIGRSCGKTPVPLVVHNERSHGGGALMTSSIIGIRKTTATDPYWLYRHPTFHQPIITLKKIRRKWAHGTLTVAVLADGKEHAAFLDYDKALRWVKKMGLADACLACPPPPHRHDHIFQPIAQGAT
jgi:hypothetical protein